jgi:hypothetical protein
VQQILDEMCEELVSAFGDTFAAGSIRTDVDVFEDGEPLVEGRRLDSMDLVRAIAAVEARFDVSLASILGGDEPMTLHNVARHVAAAGGGA